MSGCLLATWAAPAGAQTPVRWTLTVDAGAVATAGTPFEARLDARIDPGWHLYALTQPPGGPQALVISIPGGGGASLAGPVVGPLPYTAFDPNFDIETETHSGDARFLLPLVSGADAGSGPLALPVDVRYQACTDQYCLPPSTESLRLSLPAGGPLSSPVSTASPARSGAAGTTTGAARAPVPDLAAGTGAGTLGAYLGLAAVMGALSLLTPCVFPMVPITVSFFASRRTHPSGGRGGRRRTGPVALALVYGAGIVLTFTALGFAIATVFGASGVNRFAANPWLNVGVAALFVAFALSLFGVVEVVLPASLLTRVARLESGAGRVGGTLAMGLAFTLTSFTCTAPFLGTLLVVAAGGDWLWPAAGLLAFSTVFAAPFVGLALAPQLLAALPRSGPWMVAVKTVMGLLELAAAVKFLSNADLVWGWGLFTRGVVIGIWIAVGLALLAYVLGVLRIGRSGPLGRPGLPRLAAAGLVLASTVWLGAGLGGRRLGELEAFLPPADVTGQGSGDLTWIVNDYDAALARARRDGAPVFVDFTGYTCTNCRWMEANMFTRPDVARALARFVRVRLFTDGLGEPYASFQVLQREVYGTVALPYYAIVDPDGRPRVAFGGLTRDEAAFLRFLDAAR